MKLPPPVQALIAQFAARFPVPTTSDDASRDWTHRLCEQLAFSFPADGWGHKSASPTRPHSADAIAIRSPFLGWDVIDNSGGPAAALRLNGDSIDLAHPEMQTFEPVTPVNHLHVEPPEEPPTGDLETRVTALEAAVRAAASALARI